MKEKTCIPNLKQKRMYSIYSGKYNAAYYFSLEQLPSKLKAFWRLARLRKKAKKQDQLLQAAAL